MKTWLLPVRRGGPVFLAIFLIIGCINPAPPLDLSSREPSQDQWKIAEYYSHEAAVLRQKAQEMYARAQVYERLFGSDSEWVKGSRLLAQSYEDAAREHERLADEHLELAGGQRPPQLVKPGPR
ncbi:MAG: hypothetical protein C4293_18675 [Nitrospiraceae bacterium]